MSKKTIKIVSVLLMALMAISILSTSVFAFDPSSIKATTDATADTEITTIAGKILGLLQTIGIAASVIIIAILGIKYLTGSAEEKADYKKSFVPYIIGAVLIFAAPTIANIIYKLVK